MSIHLTSASRISKSKGFIDNSSCVLFDLSTIPKSSNTSAAIIPNESITSNEYKQTEQKYIGMIRKEER